MKKKYIIIQLSTGHEVKSFSGHCAWTMNYDCNFGKYFLFRNKKKINYHR